MFKEILDKKASEKKRSGHKLFEIDKGNVSGVSSNQIKEYMKKKYNLNVGEGSFNHPDNLNSFYVEREYIKPMISSLKEKKPFRDKTLSKWFPKYVAKQQKIEKDMIAGLEKVVDYPHGGIVMDSELREKAPEVTAHELGHAYNYNISKFKPLFNLRSSLWPSLLGIPLSLYGRSTDQPELSALGIGLSTLPAIGTLADEFNASRIAVKTMKELGGTPKKSRLVKAFGTYLLHSAPGLVRSGLGIGANILASNMKKEDPLKKVYEDLPESNWRKQV